MTLDGDISGRQLAAARQLSLATYLLGSERHAGWKYETEIRSGLDFYEKIYAGTLGDEPGPQDEARARDALRKQLERDLQALRRSGIEVETDSTEEGRSYRLSKKGYSPAALDLADEERAVLAGALRTFAQNFPYSIPLHLAVFHLVGELDEIAGEKFSVDLPYDAAVAGRLARLDADVSMRRSVAFEYHSITRDEVSRRLVEPYAMSLVRGHWYLVGCDTDRDARRQFRLDRIRSRITAARKGSEGGEYEIPADFDPDAYGARAPWQLDPIEGTPEARVLLREDARTAPGEYPDAGEIEESPAGPVFVTDYSGERQLASWALSLGERATVLSPAPLVDRVRRSLEHVAGVHDPEARIPVPPPVPVAAARDVRPAGGSAGVKPEPLSLALALARYAARMGEGRVSHQELADTFGVSEGDVVQALQIVEEISDTNMTVMPVYSEDGYLTKEKSGFDRDFRRPVRLSPVQARAALLALDLIMGSVDPRLLGGLRDKIAGATVGERHEVTADPPPAGPDLLATVDRARREKRVLQIEYPSGGGLETRAVEPLQTFNARAVWYLKAYCRQAQDERYFRLDRIGAACVLDERFERESNPARLTYDEVDPRTYAGGRAVVRFSPDVARWMPDRPEQDLLQTHGDGSADYALYYKEPSWAVARILSYRGEAIVLQPEELRREVHRTALELSSRYTAE